MNVWSLTVFAVTLGWNGVTSAHVDDRIRMIPKMKEPTTVFKILTNTTECLNSLKWITDSAGHTSTLLNSWMASYYGADGDLGNPQSKRSVLMSGVVKDAVKKWDTVSQQWRQLFKEKYPSFVSRTKVLNDTVLVIPVGSHRIPRTWASLESILTLTSLPAEIMLMTGVSQTPVAEEIGLFDFLATVLHTIYEPLLASHDIRIRWGVFSPKGGPAIARWMASELTDREYLVYTDNDDYLTPWSLEHRVGLMREREDIDLVMQYYVMTNWDKSADTTSYLDSLLEDIAIDSKQVLRTPEATVKEAKGVDVLEARDKILSFYYLNSSISFLGGSVAGWPALGYVGADSCSKLPQQVRERQILDEIVIMPETNDSAVGTKALGPASYFKRRNYNPDKVDPIRALREEEDLAYLKWACDEMWKFYPKYVEECANGWGAIRRKIFKHLPVTALTFGEDALVNFIAAISGFNVYCNPQFHGASYIRYGSAVTQTFFGL